MIKCSVPFLITELSQIPANLIQKNNLFLEGTVFDCKQLENKNDWDKILKNIATVNKKYRGRLVALHYPTENANYLESPKIQKKLIDFIKVSNNNGINNIILHSNYIQKIDVYNELKLKSIRNKFNIFFQELDKLLNGKKTVISIENMPIIGNDGTDFDSIFVFPSDFSDFNYKNIKITWDLGHWAYTFYFIKTLSNISTKIKTEKINFKDFYSLKKQISHLHFSSFKGVAIPKTNNVCQEGICPQDGYFDQEIFKNTIREINSSWNDIYMTLEINEKNYAKRVNLQKTLNWLKPL